MLQRCSSVYVTIYRAPVFGNFTRCSSVYVGGKHRGSDNLQGFKGSYLNTVLYITYLETHILRTRVLCNTTNAHNDAVHQRTQVGDSYKYPPERDLLARAACTKS